MIPSVRKRKVSPDHGGDVTSIPPHDPGTSLERIGWIRSPQVTALGKLGIESLRDLIMHYPRRHEDRRRFDRFPDCESERSFCICGIVGKTAFRRFGRMRSFEAELEDQHGSPPDARITLRWFNLFHVQKIILTGSRLVVYGRPRLRGRRLFMEHPEFEIIGESDAGRQHETPQEEGDQSIHLDRVVPIHPAGAGISVRVIRKLIHRALTEIDWSLWLDPLPGRKVAWSRALQSIHFPDEPEETEPARRELALRELLELQILVIARQNEMRKPRGLPKITPGTLLERFLLALPFTLTASQQRSIATIRSDMGQEHRMHRLLQGDVGSGKTVVAAAAMLLAIEAGYCAILMVPTQILAAQHFRNFRSWLEPIGIDVKLLTGSLKRGELSLFNNLARGTAIIGTHALLHHAETVKEAGLVVIDEQHKFGVLQRSQIASGSSAPDLLVMTATPIPRTLAQTIYGDLDISILNEQPPGRGSLRTVVRTPAHLTGIIDYIHGELAKGRQAYVVYHLIGESDKLATKAAETEINAWKDRLSPHSCALLHGRLDIFEKRHVMDSFEKGLVQVLVTTSVIEVGVDVPNATFLLVENAERFGLAQLHQLRGRIGRGIHSSTCVLIDGSANSSALERLSILEKSRDGFVIAEEDLRLRGAGDILGTEQSGLPPLRIADLYRDADLIPVATQEAARILRDDPELMQAHHFSLSRLRNTLSRGLVETVG